MEKSLAQIGYEAYAENTGGKTFDGREMPKWNELPARTQAAWLAASAGIASACDAAGTAEGVAAEQIAGTEGSELALEQTPRGKRMAPEREAYLRAKPAHFHLHEVFRELDVVRDDLKRAHKANSELAGDPAFEF